MAEDYVNLTEESLASEHLCCIIRKKPHPGVEAKRQWLAERLREGHVFRKHSGPGCVFIEYAPLETAWTPVEGDNWLYLYCLWVDGAGKGHGYGRELMEYCLADAERRSRSGVCMLGAKKQKAWLSDRAFAEKFGFVPVDETDDGYLLLARSFDGTAPRFASGAKAQRIDRQELTVYYDVQCPFIPQRVAQLEAYCSGQGIPAAFIRVETLQQAKALPCVFNNWAVFYQGRLQTVNQLDVRGLERLLRNGQKTIGVNYGFS